MLIETTCRATAAASAVSLKRGTFFSPPARKRLLDQLFPRLSRACLGKRSVFQYKIAQKRRFRTNTKDGLACRRCVVRRDARTHRCVAHDVVYMLANAMQCNTTRAHSRASRRSKAVSTALQFVARTVSRPSQQRSERAAGGAWLAGTQQRECAHMDSRRLSRSRPCC
jgi:hypothetical protein